MSADLRPIPPGGVVGILGGGQLGRMLATAAAELGIASHIYSPDPDSPAFDVARGRTVADWFDEKALAAFAAAVDVVTYEFENVPIETAEFLAARVPVRPRPGALAAAQDRLAEKALMREAGLQVPAYAEVSAMSDIYSALAKTGRPAVLKARRFGYDGKGQAMIRSGDDPVGAWRTIGEVPAILESLVLFEREISVLAARGLDGSVAVYDVTENRHDNHILAVSRAPAELAPDTIAEAAAIGRALAEALDYVGVLAVELFVVKGRDRPRLLGNEIAPRVHNSFHWTQDAATTSQFEQHIRAICGWPLGDPRRLAAVEMTNLVGPASDGWAALAAEPGARVHLYGKAESRPGRKMGHVNRFRGDPDAR